MTARPSADKPHATVPERRRSFSSALTCPEKFDNSTSQSGSIFFIHLEPKLTFSHANTKDPDKHFNQLGKTDRCS